MPHLAELSICHNRLAALPEGLSGSAASLAVLAAAGNRLRQLPAGLSRLGALRTTDLSANALEEAGLAPLLNLRLERLNLASNNLRGLPPELGRMTTLAVLKTQGNPIKTIPQSALNGSVAALLQVRTFFANVAA